MTEPTGGSSPSSPGAPSGAPSGVQQAPAAARGSPQGAAGDAPPGAASPAIPSGPGVIELQLDTRLYIALAGAAGFFLLFHLAYSLERSMSGALALPVWLILLNIALVVTVCRDRKLLLIGGLVLTMAALEYIRDARLPAGDTGSHLPMLIVWTLFVPCPLFLFLTLWLFARLDNVSATTPEQEGKIRQLTDETTRLVTALGEAQRRTAEESVAMAAGAGDANAYLRVFEALAGAGSATAVVAALARFMKESSLAQRGIVAEVAQERTARVCEAWGGRAPAELPPPLVALMKDRPLPLTGEDLARFRRDQPSLAAFEKQSFEIDGVYPVGDGRRLCALVLTAVSAQESRAIAVQTVADIAAQVLEKRWAGR